MSFDEAARRRDFTVNAILEDPLKGEIIDPFGGREDMEAGLLRAVAPETFVEDSLRVLRAAQFAARFDFDVEEKTIELCRVIDLDRPPGRARLGRVGEDSSRRRASPRSASVGSTASTSRRSSSPNSTR